MRFSFGPLLVLVLLSSTAHAQERAALAPSAPTAAAASFATYLQAPGHREIRFVPQAVAQLTKRLAGAPPQEAADLFRVFWRWHEQLTLDLGNAFFKRRDLQEALSSVMPEGGEMPCHHPLAALASLPTRRRQKISAAAPAAFEELRLYDRGGFDFVEGEGDWYLATDPWFLRRLAEFLPAGDFKDYVLFRAREDDQRVATDAGLVVSCEALRRRLIRWENFSRAHPVLPESSAVVDPEVRLLAGRYLLGLDNNPISDQRTGLVDTKLRASYESFLRRSARSAYYPAVRDAYGWYREHGFRADPSLVEVLRRRLLHEDFKQSLDLLERDLRLRNP